MTKKQFFEFIASFGKNPGEYSDEEIYKISVEHKKLDPADKSWKALVNILGVDKTPEALRMWVLHKQEQDGSVVRRVTTLSSGEEVPDRDSLTKKIEELYIQQTKTRDERNAYRKTLRDEARIDSLKEAIRDCTDQLNALPYHHYINKIKTDEKKEAILLLSDLHIGVQCENFYNKYNSDVAAVRLKKLAKDTIKYCRENKVDVLNVLNLGDLIHGLIHVSAQIQQEMETVSQVMVAGELVSRFLNELQDAAPIINYRSCSDNHSRTVADKSQHVEFDNLGRLVDWFLKERLANTKINFVDDNLDYSLGSFKLRNGKKCVFAHGHLDSINQSFEHFVGATKEFVDYGFLGHYHCSKMKGFQAFKIFVNGSICGVEDYALSRRLFSDPCQTLLIFDEENIINYNITLK